MYVQVGAVSTVDWRKQTDMFAYNHRTIVALPLTVMPWNVQSCVVSIAMATTIRIELSNMYCT